MSTSNVSVSKRESFRISDSKKLMCYKCGLLRESDKLCSSIIKSDVMLSVSEQGSLVAALRTQLQVCGYKVTDMEDCVLLLLQKLLLNKNLN